MLLLKALELGVRPTGHLIAIGSPRRGPDKEATEPSSRSSASARAGAERYTFAVLPGVW